MFEKHKGTVDFKLVYIRDTHPTLGFRAPTNDRRDLKPEDEPKSLADREKWACEDRKKMKCTIPIVMDTFDDRTLKAYNAFPQRVVLLDRNGRVVYVSTGLIGFGVDETAKALESLGTKK